MNKVFRRGLLKIRNITIKSVLHLLDCEIDGIKDRNILTLYEQDLCIETVKNIEERIKGTFI